MDDVKVLEHVLIKSNEYIFPFLLHVGIEIYKDGESHSFKGTITLTSGDNLTSHYLGGFKSPSGAL